MRTFWMIAYVTLPTRPLRRVRQSKSHAIEPISPLKCSQTFLCILQFTPEVLY